MPSTNRLASHAPDRNANACPKKVYAATNRKGEKKPWKSMLSPIIHKANPIK